MLSVTIYPDAAAINDLDNGGTVFDVAYVSLVNNQTYGPPALVAPSAHGRDTKRALVGEEVLYINTNLVPAFSIIERED